MCVFLIVLVKKLGILFQPSLLYLYFYQHDDHRVCTWLVYWRKIEESRANLLNKHKNTCKFFFGIYLHFQIISLCKLYTSNIVQKICTEKSKVSQGRRKRIWEKVHVQLFCLFFLICFSFTFVSYENKLAFLGKWQLSEQKESQKS